MSPGRRSPHDRRELIDLLEVHLMGEEPTLSGAEIAAEVGIPYAEARTRWRSLGFTEVDPDEPAFTHRDLEALRLTQQLVELGVVDEEDQSALVRTMGRSFARLAEWQMGLLGRVVDVDRMDVDELRAVVETVTPAVEELQSYVWRRHTLSAASRLLLAQADAEGGPDEPAEDDGTVLGVGFADIVGYTRQSRSLTRREIGRMVDHFEGRALEVVTAHGGRIIKSIGDEILFVADRPEELARIGRELVEAAEQDDRFPELRVGLAWGPALARFGDVLGPVVNIASRLTSTSRPGRVLVDRALADEVEHDASFRLRRVRRTSVKGYRKLEPWALRRGDAPDDDASSDPPAPDGGSAEQ